MLTTGSFNMVQSLLHFDSICHNGRLFTVFVACQHSAILHLNFVWHICFQWEYYQFSKIYFYWVTLCLPFYSIFFSIASGCYYV